MSLVKSDSTKYNDDDDDKKGWGSHILGKGETLTPVPLDFFACRTRRS
jgi:hypothetical protein